MSLKKKILLLILAVYLATGIIAFFVFSVTVERLMGHLGAGYAGNHALANKSLIQEPLTRELTLAQQLSQSPVIRRWLANESDPRLRSEAMEELESYRSRLRDHSWFLAINSTLHYYANDRQNKYANKELIYTLSPTNSQDSWYFATIGTVSNYAFNVNYDRGLDVRKVWINVVVRDDRGLPLAVVGTGIDLSRFLSSFVDHADPGVEHVLLDKRLAIQAHRNRSLINEQSVATPEPLRSTIARIITRQEDQDRLAVALEKLQRGSPAETLSVTVDGKPRILGVSYIRDLEWYELTLLDIKLAIHQPLIVPLFALIMLMTLILMGVSGWIVNQIILKPISEITQATQLVPEGKVIPLTGSTRRDEIGTLIRAFSEMSAKIQEHTHTLEARILERTAELDASNRTLRENINNLNEARSKVRILTGMLPVCCSCNKIRTTTNEWQPLEHYVKAHTDAEFSHGICPDCARKLYPDYPLNLPPEPPAA